MMLVGGYSVGSLFLVNNYFGSEWRRDGRWQFWYFEAFVQIMVVSAALLALPPVRRLDRRFPFGVPLGLLLVALLLRFEVVAWGGSYNHVFRPHMIVWFFLIGWAAQRAHDTTRRLVLSAAVVASVPGFFHFGQREATVIGGLLLLIWVAAIPLPRPVNRIIGSIAAASMYIFLFHWRIWPPLDRPVVKEAAFVLTVAAGIAAWWLVERAARVVRTALRRRPVAPRWATLTTAAVVSAAQLGSPPRRTSHSSSSEVKRP